MNAFALLGLMLQPTEATAPGNLDLRGVISSAPVQAAFVGALVALFGASVTLLVNSRTARQGRRQSDQQRELDFRRAQLSALYGPLFMRRAASKRLRNLLPSSDPQGTGWRLVDNIELIRDGSHTAQETVVEQILQLGREVEELLIGQAGLFDVFPPPTSFSDFIAHSRLLQLYWDRKENQPATDRLPFPQTLDADIEAAMTRVRKRLEELSSTP